MRNLRLPRAIGAVCVGRALGAAGCMLQALLRNPLASPTVIGTSQAAAFGKVLGVFLGIGYAGSIGVSFVAACCCGAAGARPGPDARGLPAMRWC